MKEIFECSAFAGVALSLVAYYIGVFLKKKLKSRQRLFCVKETCFSRN